MLRFWHIYNSYGPWWVSEFHFHSIWIEFHQILYMQLYRQYLGWGCFLSFLLLCNRVMALDWCQNVISAQYLENKWTEFHTILGMNLYWQYLGFDCHLLGDNPNLDIANINSCLKLCEILSICRLFILHKFVTELWHLIDNFTAWKALQGGYSYSQILWQF